MTQPNAVWSLSGFGDEIDPDPAIQAAALLALGASHIEVRSAWDANVSELEKEAVERLKGIFDERGLKVSAVASPIGKVDVSLPVEHEVNRLRQIISVAKGLDAKYVRIFSFYRAEGQSQEEIRDAVMERMRALAAEGRSQWNRPAPRKRKGHLRRYAREGAGHHGDCGLPGAPGGVG
ncbi:hypothetical protein StoSoilB13_44830 (plasmid) [Arthrobacter sp. StoSoilB13]|nr:hypothetical protein StoSoilB13_44830 [Arthrobacter sp. StoSoilB13]